MTEKEFRDQLKTLTSEIPVETHRTFLAAAAHRKDEIVMKRKVSSGLIIVLAISIIALTIAVAEITKSTFSVNWSGEVSDTSDGPEGDIMDMNAELRKMRAVLAGAPDDMFACVDGGTVVPGLVRGKRKVLTSMEGFEHPGVIFPADLERQDSLTVELTYDCLEGGAYQLVKEDVVDGYTLRLYRFDEEHEIISGYVVSYTDEEGYWKSVRSQLSRTQNNKFNFILMDDEEHTAETIEIPGFDQAIYVTRGLNKTLMATRTLEEPVTIINHPNPSIPDDEMETTEYFYELIEINGYTLEECLTLLGAES